MTKKVIITVGGTGGHVFPALSLARELQKAEPSIQIMFVGGNLHKNRYFDRNAHAFQSVDCGSLSKNPMKALYHSSKILKGIWQSRKIIKTFKPDVIVGFGSFYTFPTLLAAKLTSVPIILHEANSIPGKVNKLLARHALATGIHFPITAALIKGNTVEVGLPLREGYRKGAVTRKQALDHYFLAPDKITLLVFGGSQGANSINELVLKALTENYHGDLQKLQVVHFTGNSETTRTAKECYAKAGLSACVKDFENRMDMAWQAADLMISRSGAGTIAEQLEFEVPGILIPYPHSTDNHQDKNAEFMAHTVGGGVMFSEASLTAPILGQKIATVLNHDSILLRTMRHALRDYKKKTRRKDFCTFVLDSIESYGRAKGK